MHKAFNLVLLFLGMEKEKTENLEESPLSGAELERLAREQKKLSKQVKLEDAFDFSLVQTLGGLCTAFLNNKIIAAAVVMDSEMKIIEQSYEIQKTIFPYVAEFRAYRELPAMLACYNKLENVPDIVFILGHGVAHPRYFGIASHFALATQKPTIGIAKKLICGELEGDKIVLGSKVVGHVLVTKIGAKPLFVSPGGFISVDSALELTKRFTRPPHKLPEPLHVACHYSKKIREEIMRKKNL